MARPAEGSTRPPGLSTFQALTVASQFGATLAVAVALGLFAGQWLDRLLGTSVVFTLIGVFLGLITAVTSTVSVYRMFLRKSEREWRERAMRPADTTLANYDQPHPTIGRGPE